MPTHNSPTAVGASPDRVLADSLLVDDVVHPGAPSSSVPRPPGLEPQPGAGSNTMPRERPAAGTQPSRLIVPQKAMSVPI